VCESESVWKERQGRGKTYDTGKGQFRHEKVGGFLELFDFAEGYGAGFVPSLFPVYRVSGCFLKKSIFVNNSFTLKRVGFVFYVRRDFCARILLLLPPPEKEGRGSDFPPRLVRGVETVFMLLALPNDERLLWPDILRGPMAVRVSGDDGRGRVRGERA
jgi:hypothetical protein